jgi:hypothetical protein
MLQPLALNIFNLWRDKIPVSARSVRADRPTPDQGMVLMP